MTGGGGDGGKPLQYSVEDNGREFLLSLIQQHNRQTQSLPDQHPPPPPPLQRPSQFPSYGGKALQYSVEDNGREFLLSLIQQHNRQTQSLPDQHPPPPPPLQRPSQFPSLTPPFSIQHQQPHLTVDPAIAAIGPSISFAPPPLRQPNGPDLSSPPWPHALYSRFPFPQTPSPPQGSQFQFVDDLQRLGLSSMDARANDTIQHLIQQKQQLEQKLQFGSIPADIRNVNGSNSNFNAAKEWESRNFNAGERNRQFDGHTSSKSQNFAYREQGHMAGLVKQQHGGNYVSPGPRTQPPPGFTGMQRGGGGDSDYMSRRKELDPNLSRDRRNHTEFNNRGSLLSSGNNVEGLRLTEQLDRPGPPAGSKLHTIPGSKKEDSSMNPIENGEVSEVGKNDRHEFNDLCEDLVDSLLVEGESDGKKEKKPIRNIRDKEFRADNRGQWMLSQRMRILKQKMQCRRDMDRMNVPFLATYESLIPPEEEKAKQKQLLALLEKLINKEWPDARLYLYGSCANSFGVSKSDIDVCFAIGDADVNKSEVLLKLADILQSDNLQNVQALTRARVPIVKLMDPVTGISCDVCINNVLAVVNTKLLRDYAEIDVRLRQLAFIVKHWAKSRGVNETYQGTLSSYAYVLMCIHFLQQRRPAILPCLQGMKATYSVTVDGVECAYFDRVGELRGFGSRNRETIAQLVWGFFNYWAYHHDYANDVISVRRGCLISKQEKDWTRRVGNDRHLICIEDPFQTSHDLGRVVDKFSIRVLREEFERAADIMQHAPNPCVTLLEPYVSS